MATAGASAPSGKRFANWLQHEGVRKLSLWVSLLVIIILLLCAVLAPFLAPYGPHEMGLRKGEQGVGPFVSLQHPLGVDRLERDTLSRLIYGARMSVFVVLSTVALSAAVGAGLGLAAGYFGGWVDHVLTGLAAAISRVPPGWRSTLLSIVLLALGFYMALVLVSNLDSGINNVVIALSIIGVPRTSLAVRNIIRGIRGRNPAGAAEPGGTTPPLGSRREMLFSIFIGLLIVGSLQAKQIFVAETLLSFLGVGIAWGEPAWGIMAADGRTGMGNGWFPMACIVCAAAALHFFGHWVRDMLVPRLPRIARL